MTRTLSREIADHLAVTIPFVYEADVWRPRARSSQRKLYREYAEIFIPSVAETEIAYTVEINTADQVPVCMHEGHLYWPVRFNTPISRPNAVDALQQLRDGELDLFTDSKLSEAGTQANDLSWTKCTWSGREEALREVQARASRSLAIIKGELFAKGGVPIFLVRNAATSPNVSITSSGATRSTALQDRLSIEPAGFHLPLVQGILARGRFQVASLNTSGIRHQPRVFVHKEFEVDRLDLQLDAIFRILLQEITHLRKPRNPDRLRYLRDAFTKASPLTSADLTGLRCEALHLFLEEWRIEFGENINVRATLPSLERSLELASSRAKTITHDVFLERKEQALTEALMNLPS